MPSCRADCQRVSLQPHVDRSQSFENGLQRISLGIHFENEILPRKQRLLAFCVFDVCFRSEPFDNSCVAAQRRSRAEKKPAIHAIELSTASFNFTRLSRSDSRSPVDY